MRHCRSQVVRILSLVRACTLQVTFLGYNKNVARQYNPYTGDNTQVSLTSHARPAVLSDGPPLPCRRVTVYINQTFSRLLQGSGVNLSANGKSG